MEPLLIIAKPAASGFTGAALRTVTRVLSERFEVETDWPTSAIGSREAAVKAAGNGFDVVAAMGGDGVAHHVANGLVHTDTALALLPAGTTNVMARIIGMPTKPAKAAAALVKSKARPTNLAHVSGSGRSDYALFALGIGIDADMIRASEKRPRAKGTIGSLHYARSAVSVAVRDYRTKPANLIASNGDDTVHAVSVMVQVRKQYTFFGPIVLSLASDVSSGPTAVAIADLPLARTLGIIGRAAMRRNLTGASGVTVWPAFDKLIVEADPAASIQADGDLLGTGRYFEITPAPDALMTMFPS